jgi:hypothetical protein
MTPPLPKSAVLPFFHNYDRLCCAFELEWHRVIAHGLGLIFAQLVKNDEGWDTFHKLIKNLSVNHSFNTM